jgi:hypothetical protein
MLGQSPNPSFTSLKSESMASHPKRWWVPEWISFKKSDSSISD